MRHFTTSMRASRPEAYRQIVIGLVAALFAVIGVMLLSCNQAHARGHHRHHVRHHHHHAGHYVRRHNHHRARHLAKHHRRHHHHIARLHRGHAIFDANGNGSTVHSRSGVTVRVAPSARAALQCVVDYVEAHGVKITAMRGYGVGTVPHSLHPSGRALDINQYARNRTRPHVPASVSNAAGAHCGVVSGARWSYADNGHWNVGTYTAHRHHHRGYARTFHARRRQARMM